MPGLRRTRPLPVAAPTPTAPVRPRFKDAGPGDTVSMGKGMIGIPKGMPVPPGWGKPVPTVPSSYVPDPSQPTPLTLQPKMAPPTGMGMAPPTGMAKGGKVASASKRADGIAQRGKTKGKMY